MNCATKCPQPIFVFGSQQGAQHGAFGEHFRENAPLFNSRHSVKGATDEGMRFKGIWFGMPGRSSQWRISTQPAATPRQDSFHGPEVVSSSETEEPVVDAFLVAGKADAACHLKSRTMNFVSVLAFLRLVGQLTGLANEPAVRVVQADGHGLAGVNPVGDLAEYAGGFRPPCLRGFWISGIVLGFERNTDHGEWMKEEELASWLGVSRC
jgi:hypothetical protein